MHGSALVQDTNPLKQPKAKELSINPKLTTSSDHRIPIKQFHRTTLAKIIEEKKLSGDCQQIVGNNIRFYAPNQEPERIKARNTRKIVSLHGWKRLQISVLGFIAVQNSSLQTLDYLVGKGFYKLKQLKVKFVWSSYFHDQHLKTAVSYATRNLQQTQRLAIIISNSRFITDSGLKQAGSLIAKNVPNLKSLRYDAFLSPHVNGTDFVSKLTRNSPKLKKLFLNFGGTNQEDNSIVRIAKTIGRNLANLEHLRLYFWDAQAFTDEGLANFAAQVCQNLRSLKSLYLNFRSCCKLSERGIDALLREANDNLVNLKSLVLIGTIFNGNDYVNNHASKMLENLPHLEICSIDDHDDMNYHH